MEGEPDGMCRRKGAGKMIETTSLSEGVAMSVDVTEARETPPPPGRRFAEALAAGVEVLAQGAGEALASALPGGGIVAAAARELSPMGSGGSSVASGERAEGPGGLDASAGSEGSTVDAYWKLQQQSQDFNLQFLQLQEGLSQENRRFSTLSNVLKARHDTSKTVIQNIR
jgi:hypothetical protein